MENENTDNENIIDIEEGDNTINSENVENTSNTENSENTENTSNNTIDNSATSENVYNTENTLSNTIQNIDLQIIHEDLGIIISFIALFSVVILIHYTYKFFKMFF